MLFDKDLMNDALIAFALIPIQKLQPVAAPEIQHNLSQDHDQFTAPEASASKGLSRTLDPAINDETL
jgi:hypothetical protein